MYSQVMAWWIRLIEACHNSTNLLHSMGFCYWSSQRWITFTSFVPLFLQVEKQGERNRGKKSQRTDKEKPTSHKGEDDREWHRMAVSRMAQNVTTQAPDCIKFTAARSFSSSIVNGLNERHLGLRFAVEIGTMEAAASHSWSHQYIICIFQMLY